MLSSLLIDSQLIELKRICILNSTFYFFVSLLGVDKVIQYAVTEWLTDIRKNQLPGILGGVGPMHSVVQLCESLIQCVTLEHWHR